MILCYYEDTALQRGATVLIECFVLSARVMMLLKGLSGKLDCLYMTHLLVLPGQ